MGKFDGILLCTDFDMTLAEKAVISPENAAAIRYFQENGGRFTVVSGRNPYFLTEHLGEVRVNAPLVGYNGALILDESATTVLFSGGRHDLDALDFAEKFWNKDTRIFSIVPHDERLFLGACKREPQPDCVLTVDELRTKCKGFLHNVICSFLHTEDAIAVRDEMIAAAGDKFVVLRSWERGVEIINPWDQKGVAALRVKEMVGAKTLICAGDFENDISMIKAADVGYAVENAVPEVKAVADRITVDFRKHAMVAIVSDLEKML